MSYVIWRYNPHYTMMVEFVSDPNTNGTGGSFTRLISKAKRFRNTDDADKETCPENEHISNIERFLAPEV